ncbi:MAG: TolC family protein [Acidobacteriaceae bacterium]
MSKNLIRHIGKSSAKCALIVVTAASAIFPVSALSQQQGSAALQSIQEALSPSPLQGSVTREKATNQVLPLSLADAIQRSLRYNLGLIESNTGAQRVRAEQVRQLANLLPQVNATISETAQQINLAALGFPAGKIPGVPSIVGPFVVFDARANLSQSVFNWNLIQKARASREVTRGTVEALRNTRELVVLSTGNSYLQVTTAISRVEAAQSEVNTADALYKRAVDQQNAGVTPKIDALRAQVELQARQQQLIQAQNNLDKSRLQLARTIGLPLDQRYEVTDRVPYQPLPALDFKTELERAYQRRADFLQAQSLVKAAELSKSAAVAEHYPSLGINGYYGDEGLNSPFHSHGVFAAAAGIQIPIFAGWKTRADIQEADANLTQRRAELDDLRSRIEYEIRNAFLDVMAAAKQVEVAQSSLQLANETLTQAQDRFAAGVADNLEVVQAQDSVATANESYIAAVYQHNISKVILARSVGVAEQAVEQYLKGTGK